MLFSLGRVVATPTALDLGIDFIPFLRKHKSGDWGELDEHDKAQNDWGVGNMGRIFSAYSAPNGTKFWIITEWDRSVTTILLPSDY
jgi:hypothetical protein